MSRLKLMTLLLPIAVLALAIGGPGCGGSSAAPVCPRAQMPDDSVWREVSVAFNESIRLAQAGQGEAAVEAFFTSGHDPLHLITAALCSEDEKRSRRLTELIDDFHFDFDPEDPRGLAKMLTDMRTVFVEAADARGSQLD
jgi:hypothetical protein